MIHPRKNIASDMSDLPKMAKKRIYSSVCGTPAIMAAQLRPFPCNPKIVWPTARDHNNGFYDLFNIIFYGASTVTCVKSFMHIGYICELLPNRRLPC